MKDTYRYKNIIVVLFLAIVSLGLLFLSENMPQGIWQNIVNQISLAILISGILGLINEYMLKESLVELILNKVKIKSDVDSTGIELILARITEIDYKLYFKKAKKNIDIVHIYGRTWTNSHLDEIMDRVKSVNCKVRVILVDPNSLFVPALEKHYGYEDGQLKSLIEEVSDIWRKQYKKIEDMSVNKKRKKQKIGKIELYYHNGQPTNSMYKIDDRIVVIQTKTTKEKTTRLPAMIFKNTKKDDCFFKIYDKEINQLIKESRLVDLSN